MKLAAFVTSVALFGCVDGPSGSEPEDQQTGRLAANGLSSGNFLNALQGGIYNPAMLTPTTMAGMTNTANRQATAVYVIGCALATGHNIVYNSVTYQGAIGLADNWTSGSLTTAQQQLVTSCVLSRVNYFARTVEISVRGPISPQYDNTTTELANYTGEEGAFWGNIFVSTGTINACEGVDETANPSWGNFVSRVCAEPDPNNPGYTLCGFVNHGSCTTACTDDSAGYYTGCSSHEGAYSEVTTVYDSLP